MNTTAPEKHETTTPKRQSKGLSEEERARKKAEAEAKKQAVADEKARKKAEAAAERARAKAAKDAETARKKAEAAAERAREKDAKAAEKKAVQDATREAKRKATAEEKARKKAAADAERARAKAVKAAEAQRAKALAEAAENERLAQLPRRLVSGVTSQRNASNGSYPVPEATLLRLAGAPANKKTTASVWKDEYVLNKLIACRSGPDVNGKSYALRADLACSDAVIMTKAIALAKQERPPKPKRGSAIARVPSNAFTAKDLAVAIIIDKSDQSRFIEAIELAVERRQLCESISWLSVAGQRVYFLREDISASDGESNHSPAGATAGEAVPKTDALHATRSTRLPSDFAAAFNTAFEKANLANGGLNFVKLSSLRDSLAHLSRDVFDAGLRDLRLRKLYSLESSDGASVRLTAEERAAGIKEGSSLFVYVSRR